MAKNVVTASTSKEEQDVIDTLGDSGKKVIAFVNKTIADKLSANAEELRDAATRFNEYVAAAKVREDGNTKLLTELHDALGRALGAHSSAATDLNDGKQVTPAAIDEVIGTTAEVQRLELEWKTMVDETLADHGRRITALENNGHVPTLAPVPPSEPQPEPSGPSADDVPPDNASAVAFIDQNPNTVTVARYVNPRCWGGLAWLLAVIGFIVGAIVAMSVAGSFFPHVVPAIQWVRYVTLWMFPVFGFLAGGALGSYIESRRSTTETTVA